MPHLDAEDRALWRGVDDERPLSDLGRRQAQALAQELARKPVDGLYSSPAFRCVQTLEPLAAMTGRPVITLAGLREQQRSREGDEALAKRGLMALEEAEESGGGRVIVCSRGDLVPTIVESLLDRHRLRLPSRLSQRGEWYTISRSGSEMFIRLNRCPEGFPR